MKWHLIEGEPGCRYAVEHACVAVIVDALRASATAAMLLDEGASQILVVAEVDNARAAKKADPEALLYGERNGLPPEGFDGGNSPRKIGGVSGQRIILTTTSGTQRVVQAWGANDIIMATTVNAMAAATYAAGSETDVVLIPAGREGAPLEEAQEDLAAAAAIGVAAAAEFGEGALLFRHWRARLENEGLASLFESAPHAERLREIGYEADIAFCAQLNRTQAVPRAIDRNEFGVFLQRAT